MNNIDWSKIITPEERRLLEDKGKNYIRVWPKSLTAHKSLILMCDEISRYQKTSDNFKGNKKWLKRGK